MIDDFAKEYLREIREEITDRYRRAWEHSDALVQWGRECFAGF